jgi:hypothetical protein
MISFLNYVFSFRPHAGRIKAFQPLKEAAYVGK